MQDTRTFEPHQLLKHKEKIGDVTMTAMDAPNGDPMTWLLYELREEIFQYLGPADLCRLAICCRGWRCAVNRDIWWRPLCRRNGWEYYSNAETSILEKIPHELNGKMTFPADAIVREDNPTGLPSTCKWKEIYMKARHLEGNWEKDRCHVTTLKAFGDDDPEHRGSGRRYVRSWDGDGDLFALGFSDGTIKVWDVRRGICERVFRVGLSGLENTLKVSQGTVVAGCREGLVRAFRVGSGRELPPMRGHKKTNIQRVFFDGETVVSRAAGDDDIRVWTAADGACRHVLAGPEPESRLEGVDHRDGMVAAMYSDDRLRVWDSRSGRCLHSARQADHLLSLKLGRGGTVASLHRPPGHEAARVSVRIVQTGQCTTVPVHNVAEPGASARRLWLQNCFANGALFLRALPHPAYEGAYLSAAPGRGAQFLATLGHLKTVFCFHGNRCVLEDRYNYQENEYHIYRASAGGLEPVRSATHADDGTGKRLTLWMDDTKIVFQNRVKDLYLYVHHYW